MKSSTSGFKDPHFPASIGLLFSPPVSWLVSVLKWFTYSHQAKEALTFLSIAVMQVGLATWLRGMRLTYVRCYISSSVFVVSFLGRVWWVFPEVSLKPSSINLKCNYSCLKGNKPTNPRKTSFLWLLMRRNNPVFFSKNELKQITS